jgi:uncharacterized damage-inducible protein DinB
MTLASSLLPEFDHEFANTRKMLALVPDDQLTWKPHQKSMELGRLAWHTADFPDWCRDTLNKPGLTLTEADGAKYMGLWKGKTREQILARFDHDLGEARKALENISDEEMGKNWKMEWMGETVIDMPKIAVYRSMVLNHMIHHRAQLGVYYRLLGIAVPGMYGPSADEMPAMTQSSAA